MLRYKVKLGNNDIKRCELEWGEKYLSQDLSYITGVTSPEYHLEKFDKLASTNTINNTDSALNVESVNVKRQGYIVIEEKEYETFPSSIVDYSIVNSGDTKNYRYMVNNGKYFYWNELVSGYVIDNLWSYDNDKDEVTYGITIECAKDANPIKIDTVYWIEDGKVEIDGNSYFFDKNEEGGILKYKDGGEALPISSITKCSGVSFHPYSSSTMYEEVTKFKLTKNENQNENFSKISFAKYYYYVVYKDHYCLVKQKFVGSTFNFVCEIPLYVISGNSETMLDNLDVKEYELYFAGEYGEDGLHYEDYCNESHKINSANLSEHQVYNMNDLKNVISFIHIDEEEKAYFRVEHDVLNGNDGNGIIVYADNEHSQLNEGDKIFFSNANNTTHEAIVYNSLDYGGFDEEFVIYNSKKYLVEKNLLDKVIIDSNEYDVEYNNEKVSQQDCLVTINSEKVPMKIDNVSNGKFSSGTFKRYGKIVTSASSAATDAVYDVKPYDGVTIGDAKYIINEVVIPKDGEDDAEVRYKYASIGLPPTYTFNIVEKIGNSTYVCEPDINSTEFTSEFKRHISFLICNDVVSNQTSYLMYVKNKIFGDREITKDLPFLRNDSPISSDDYYNLFENLTIFVKNKYIQIPLLLNMDAGGNPIQEDVVKRDFYESNKNKAINPIVDMEKDVYMPKYIYGYYDENGDIHAYGREEHNMYRGSSTIFKPIYQINLNFHFRTRNLDNWKINDGNAIITTNNALDNWFITDFHPYRDILNRNRVGSGQTLMEASDLMGLLDFTNDDVFYQRSRVGKSFARLSFYDSTDPQTQSLLATSCVFMDEHRLFKTFIDNSRKYEREYASVSQSQDIIYKSNKISVNTEYLGLTRDDEEYSNYSGNCLNVDVGAENHRVSSRMVINNKYTTDTSSEGFYLYIFKEYSENLRPKPIYMKIEFNHAGIGKTIPFLIPMHWGGNTTDSGGTDYNRMYPTSAWTFQDMNDETDRESSDYENSIFKFKEGFPLSYVYAQTYIPLYAVYDFENKEYGYVFDERYVRQDESGTLNLNLFEMKIMDESNNTPDTAELNDIKQNKQKRAVININTNQFDLKSFNKEME